LLTAKIDEEYKGLGRLSNSVKLGRKFFAVFINLGVVRSILRRYPRQVIYALLTNIDLFRGDSRKTFFGEEIGLIHGR